MNWDFSTYRKAAFQTILILYGFTIFAAIAAQHIVNIRVDDLTVYLLAIVGTFGLVLYARIALGWTIPRAWFFVIVGGASVFAVQGFSQTNNFALVCLAGAITCALILTGFLVMGSIAKFHQHTKKRLKDDTDH